MWQCDSECLQPSEEIDSICTTNSLFKIPLDWQGLDKVGSGCTLVQQARAKYYSWHSQMIENCHWLVSIVDIPYLAWHILSCPLRVNCATSTHLQVLRRIKWLFYFVRERHLVVTRIDIVRGPKDSFSVLSDWFSVKSTHSRIVKTIIVWI